MLIRKWNTQVLTKMIQEIFLNFQLSGLGGRIRFPCVLTVHIPSQTLALLRSGCRYDLARLCGLCALKWAGTALDLKFKFSKLKDLDVHGPPAGSRRPGTRTVTLLLFSSLRLGEDCRGPTLGSMQRKSLPNWSGPRRSRRSLPGPRPRPGPARLSW
jgi:hypothetical protein